MPRMTVEFPEEVSEILEDIAKGTSTSKREVIRRSLALYNHLYHLGVMTPGSQKRLKIIDNTDKVEREILFT